MEVLIVLGIAAFVGFYFFKDHIVEWYNKPRDDAE